jgi:Spy/CpxP family protein refolding chaperone
MKRFRLLTTGVIVAGLVAVAAAVQAQGPGPGGPGGRFRHGGFGGDLPLRALALTEAQRQQVREIGERHRANLQAAGEQLRKAFEAQRTAVQALPVDESAIRATTEALATAQTAMAIERAQIRSEIVSMLTPEQTDKLKQWQAERQTRMKERQERRQQRRQQPPQQG